MSKPFALIVAAVALAAAVWPVAVSAQSNAGGTKTQMHPSTLTARSPQRGHARGHHRYHNHVHSTFNQRTPIHGTMAGPRM